MKRWLAVAVLMAGCGAESGPDSVRLTPGQVAMVAGGVIDIVQVIPENGDKRAIVGVNPGVLVQCEDDTGRSAMDTPIGDPADTRPKMERRAVRVLILDGEHKGMTGYVQRYQLRPVAE